MDVDVDKGHAIYERIRNKLMKDKGKIVAIEIESGDYFVGKDSIEAADKARQKYPDKLFYFMRIGAKAMYFIGCI